MSLLLRRSFANSARKLALRVQTGSSTLDEVQTMNGPMGKIWRSNLTNAVDQVEKGVGPLLANRTIRWELTSVCRIQRSESTGSCT